MILNNNIELNICTVDKLYRLRKDILRPDSKSMKSVHFDSDKQTDSVHIALSCRNKVIGCVSLMSHNKALFNDRLQLQMRGMAVDHSYQNCGYGRQLILYAEKMAILLGVRRIWMNARVDVIDFYIKQGYSTVGARFDIPNVCQHIVMSKLLPEHCLTIRPYQDGDKDYVRQICIRTAYPPFNAKYNDCLTLLFNDYYTENEASNCYVIDNNGVAVGYILCSTNDDFAQSIIRYMRLASKSSWLFALIAGIGMRVQNKYHAQYKAHMHIDIMPAYQRLGYGTRLVDTLLSHLRDNSIKSVMLCCRADNVKAVNFYTRYGYRQVDERFRDKVFVINTDNKE
ncbi:MAG: GNAT family N-acetyltransferase [Clostridia bacterium]|nr:GNAT family N-acetyltransferase [Clostridia bacterium]